jgi:hypothetical protein
MIAIETAAEKIIRQGIDSAAMSFVLLLGFETLAERNGPNIGCSNGRALQDRIHATSAIPIFEDFSKLLAARAVEPADQTPRCDFWRLTPSGRALFNEVLNQLGKKKRAELEILYAPAKPKQRPKPQTAAEIRKLRDRKLGLGADLTLEGTDATADDEGQGEDDDIELEEAPDDGGELAIPVPASGAKASKRGGAANKSTTKTATPKE